MKSYLLLFLIGCSFSLLGQNSFVINSGTNVNVTGNSNIHLKDAKLTNNGVFNNPSGTVVIEGSGASSVATIGGTSSTTFHNLQVNKASNDAKLLQNITVNNNLSLPSGKLEIGNHNVKMGDAATFSNINKDRYVKTNGTGTLQRKVGNSFVIFPVGKATFNPARLKNDGTVDVFSVRVIDHLYQNGTSGTSLTNNVVPKTWMISEEVVGGSDVTMRLIWRPAHNGSGFDANASQISHFTGGVWQDLGSATAATADNSFNSDHKYREANNITSFSPFGVKSGARLPVELLYFYAEKEGDDVRLDWQTATELNNSHFDVEWSVDGFNFEKIGEVAGAGTTNDVQFYDFLHETPVRGENYYRLRQVDYDGKFVYTDILSVLFDEQQSFSFNIYPNPAAHYLKIEASEAGMMQMFDVAGRLVVEQQLSVFENIDITQLPSGTYFIRMDNQVKKLVIQR